MLPQVVDLPASTWPINTILAWGRGSGALRSDAFLDTTTSSGGVEAASGVLASFSGVEAAAAFGGVVEPAATEPTATSGVVGSFLGGESFFADGDAFFGDGSGGIILLIGILE